ncbi:hypothetical protein F0M18_13795 [Pseudohalioglobus sediminis]|uniref:Uncharacterized protein n=1 Tax=Pseudohalioglobus sediminis TaxID=2606449 RepID=A0A5B0WT71_9GAMM|nr:hypothetical protein F0M18_13795 [Pseudohalioglobus sediminis]
MSGKRHRVATRFSGHLRAQPLVNEVADEVWLVSFLDYDLGFFDRELNKVEPVGKNPFAPKVLPMLPE